jgi:hypothetical protein
LEQRRIRSKSRCPICCLAAARSKAPRPEIPATGDATLKFSVLTGVAAMIETNVVLLTQLGGGAFGNHDDWIHAAMRRALEMMWGFDLDVRLVSYGTPSRAILQMAEHFN